MDAMMSLVQALTEPMNAGSKVLMIGTSTSVASQHNVDYKPTTFSPLPHAMNPEAMSVGPRGISPRTVPLIQAPPLSKPTQQAVQY